MKYLNLICFVLHLVSSIVMFREHDNVKADITMYLLYVKANGTGDPNQWTLALDTYPNRLNVFVLAGLFFIITAISHLIYFYKEDYCEDITESATKMRFVEYSLTAPIMIAIIALLFGVHELYLLASLVTICHSVMLFGLLDETQSILGWSPYILLWSILAAFYHKNALENDIPGFVLAIFIIEILLFTSFGFVKAYFHYGSHTAVTPDFEIQAYNILSLTSKLCLGWITYGGIKNI